MLISLALATSWYYDEDSGRRCTIRLFFVKVLWTQLSIVTHHQKIFKTRMKHLTSMHSFTYCCFSDYMQDTTASCTRFHPHETYFTSLFINTLLHHQKCWYDSLFNAHKTPLRMPPFHFFFFKTKKIKSSWRKNVLSLDQTLHTLLLQLCWFQFHASTWK